MAEIITEIREVTVTAPVNIAVIKYWGKRDTALILPTNSSLSVTLSQHAMRAKTSARVSIKYTRDALFLNGVEEAIEKSRFARVVSEARRIRQEMESTDSSLAKLSRYPIQIVSENNFPTAAGLASSAAGFAALAFSLAHLYALPQTLSETSKLARIGSGSACRSLFGGYVEWEMGTRADGEDSIAVQIAPSSHWAISALVLIASDFKKHTSSTAGMQTSVQTSAFLQHRIAHVVPSRMAEMRTAILAKDFPKFGELTMKDSNQFHAVCLDTYPPIVYLNDASHGVVRIVEAYNMAKGKIVAAYTFDAGANAVVYCETKDLAEVDAVLRFYCTNEGCTGKYAEIVSNVGENASSIQGIKRIIITEVGEGPEVLAWGHDPSASLMNADGSVIRVEVDDKTVS